MCKDINICESWRSVKKRGRQRGVGENTHDYLRRYTFFSVAVRSPSFYYASISFAYDFQHILVLIFILYIFKYLHFEYFAILLRIENVKRV